MQEYKDNRRQCPMEPYPSDIIHSA